MTDDEWGPWIEHDGGDCPVPESTIVEAFDLEGDFYDAGPADTLGWPHDEWNSMLWWIIRYRVRKPRAMKQIRALLENLPERVDA